VLAEAIWRESSDVPSASAGTHPAEQINPRAQEAAKRFGLTLEGALPRSLDTVVQPDDLVVSVCDSVNEELSPFTQAHVHWSIPDPAAIGTASAFTDAVEELRERIDLLAPRVHRKNTSSHRKAHV
jgi:protein-tyrosine-phosphatase